MLDFCDMTFSSVHMLSHTRREAGTWPKAFVLQHVGLSLNQSRSCITAIPSMRKRRTLAYLLMVRILVYTFPRGGDLHTIYEVVQIGEAVSPGWIRIKVLVGGELNGTTIPHSM